MATDLLPESAVIEPRRITPRLTRYLYVSLATIVLIVAIGGWIAARSEKRHSDALAHLAAAGASVSFPNYGTGLRIYFFDERFTDEHFRYLKDLKGLQELLISDAPQITDAGFAMLGRRTDTRVVILGRTGVTGATLRQITQWRDLNHLATDEINATGSDLADLQYLTNLKILTLECKALTDADVPGLKKLTSLNWLALTKTQISDPGFAELKNAIPHARVER